MYGTHPALVRLPFSIHLIVEVALEGPHGPMSRKSLSGFNPPYRGSSLGRLKVFLLIQMKISFNPPYRGSSLGSQVG